MEFYSVVVVVKVLHCFTSYLRFVKFCFLMELVTVVQENLHENFYFTWRDVRRNEDKGERKDQKDTDLVKHCEAFRVSLEKLLVFTLSVFLLCNKTLVERKKFDSISAFETVADCVN